MKILMINKQAYPDVVGGAQVYAHELMKNLRRRGHTVKFISSTKKARSLTDYYNSLWDVKKQAEQLHRDSGFDLVNFHCSRTPSFLFSSKAFKQVPFVFNCQADPAAEYQWETPQRTFFHYRWLRHCTGDALKRAQKIVVLSDYVKDGITQKYGCRYLNKMVRIPSGVDIVRFRPAPHHREWRALRVQLNIPIRQMVFLAVRRLTRRMGLLNLVDAVKIVLEKRSYLRGRLLFVLIGKGELREQIQQRITRYDLDDTIRLEGFVSDDLLPLYYRCADLSIIPSEALEGFGLVILESWASDTPVIGTPCGAIPEVIGEFNPDMIAKSCKPKDLAEKIITTATREKREGFYRRIAEDKFSWDVVTDKIERLFENETGK